MRAGRWRSAARAGRGEGAGSKDEEDRERGVCHRKVPLVVLAARGRAAGAEGPTHEGPAAEACAPPRRRTLGAVGRRQHLKRVDPRDYAWRVDPLEAAEHVETRDAEVGDSEPVGVQRGVRRGKQLQAAQEVLGVSGEVDARHGGNRASYVRCITSPKEPR